MCYLVPLFAYHFLSWWCRWYVISVMTLRCFDWKIMIWTILLKRRNNNGNEKYATSSNWPKKRAAYVWYENKYSLAAWSKCASFWFILHCYKAHLRWIWIYKFKYKYKYKFKYIYKFKYKYTNTAWYCDLNVTRFDSCSTVRLLQGSSKMDMNKQIQIWIQLQIYEYSLVSWSKCDSLIYKFKRHGVV